MKIVDIKTAVVAYHGKATLVRIDTDEGLSGFGEANPDAGAAAIVGLTAELTAELIGEDPRNVEHCWEKLRRRHVFSGAQAGVFMIALSGIEIALWDLAAKAAGQPLYRMLGANTATASVSMPIAATETTLPALPKAAPPERDASSRRVSRPSSSISTRSSTPPSSTLSTTP